MLPPKGGMTSREHLQILNQCPNDQNQTDTQDYRDPGVEIDCDLVSTGLRLGVLWRRKIACESFDQLARLHFSYFPQLRLFPRRGFGAFAALFDLERSFFGFSGSGLRFDLPPLGFLAFERFRVGALFGLELAFSFGLGFRDGFSPGHFQVVRRQRREFPGHLLFDLIGFAFGLNPQLDLFAGRILSQPAALLGLADARLGVSQRRAESGRHGSDPVSGRLIDFDVAERADRPSRRQVDLQRAAIMLLRSRVRKLLTRRTGGLRHPPVEHFMMLSQRRIVEIQQRHRAMVAGVKPRIDRAETERALFDRNVGPPDLPGDEGLAIAAVNPWAGIGEIVREGVFVIALFAYDYSARTRHGEGGVMLQAMNFDYICKHVSVG